MLRLPVELLTRIALYLDPYIESLDEPFFEIHPNASQRNRKDIYAFCLISRECRAVGQQILYRSVRIESTKHAKTLSCTLRMHPELPTKVRRLQLTTTKTENEPELIPGFLSVMSNVAMLDLNVQWSGQPTFALDAITKPLNADPLQHVTTLQLTGDMLAILSYELPCLSRLWLKELPDELPNIQRSHEIGFLGIEAPLRSTEPVSYMNEPGPWWSSFERLGCVQVKELEVFFHSVDHELAGMHFTGQYLIDQVHKLWPDLQKLDIKLDSHIWFETTASFQRFESLTHLSVPYHLLLDEHCDKSKNSLPYGLQELEIILEISEYEVTYSEAFREDSLNFQILHRPLRASMAVLTNRNLIWKTFCQLF
ncbi:hypothetical protein BU24DRAFT_417442 [Aaosphaeria arxii CBS 175.79]|uniref:F-box domain-containing protein n=1 Tax=Aaosphaeria arxii CBS 175.79 TaxID=1450172 RepID=A0A6A5YAS8_9PLEO|nr:uncharacterized protein BU24DRAFT_417442 [Aaosphaeria arxii CBS 175.79]KAF2021811.1 hypothetical protein BU24DRAFT_417442 [Aaosphaeria arxii CBS 175.79]